MQHFRSSHSSRVNIDAKYWGFCLRLTKSPTFLNNHLFYLMTSCDDVFNIARAKRNMKTNSRRISYPIHILCVLFTYFEKTSRYIASGFFIRVSVVSCIWFTVRYLSQSINKTVDFLLTWVFRRLSTLEK